MYTVREPKANFSNFREAEKGKEVIIARGCTPIAELIALRSALKKRKPGRYKDVIKIHPMFYEPMRRDEVKDRGIEP